MTHASTSFAEGALAARLTALPEAARQKREHLRRVARLAQATRDGLYEQAERVRQARDEARGELARFDRRYRPEAAFEYEDDPATGARRRVAAEFPEREALVQTIEAGTAELKRLQDALAGALTGFVFDDIDACLLDQPPSRKFVDARVSPKLAKGETFAAALERNREAQARITDELARVRSAPLTIAEAKALMREQVTALAERGKPNVTDLFRGGVVQWATEQFAAGGHGAHQFVVTATVKNVSALTAWLHRGAIIAALDAEIELRGNDTGALSAADQTRCVAECEAALLQLQREAEAIIERLEGDGSIVRRACTDPLVLLGVEPVRQ